MTKNEIIYLVVGGIISALSRIMLDRVLVPYIPDNKKLGMLFRKFILFAIWYLAPVSFIIFSLISVKVIDKWFVFGIALSFSVLAVNIAILGIDSLRKNVMAVFKEQIELEKLKLEGEKLKLESEKLTKQEEQLAIEIEKLTTKNVEKE